MNHETLRVLFELLCEELEEHSAELPSRFQGGYGFEHPAGAVMVFLFERFALVWRFGLSAQQRRFQQRPLCQQPIEADECLHMVQQVQSMNGGFSQLFASQA